MKVLFENQDLIEQGRWDVILANNKIIFNAKRTPDDLRHKWINILKAQKKAEEEAAAEALKRKRSSSDFDGVDAEP